MLNYQQQLQQQQFIPQQQSSNPSFGMDSTMSTDDNSSRDFPETHKSMWAINHLCISERGKSLTRVADSMCVTKTSSSVLSESESSYRTRSLPAWGKTKQRPVSITADLEELYTKVSGLAGRDRPTSLTNPFGR